MNLITYAYRNRVVIRKIILDMMVVQCRDSLTPKNHEKNGIISVSSSKTQRQNESRTHNKLLVKQISMQILSRSTMALASSSRKVAWPNRLGTKERSWSVSRGVLAVV